ncbi:ATP-grasp domain-containing protein [Streptomyces sp. NPDC001848]|uniref:ATP-grasp domain-containing protein n=1 Tax=Streptomyces sp. NPDC001848 TaxID=3364618 RepID=UPI0036BE2EEB
MTRPNRILLVGGPGYQLQKAKDLGLDVVYVQTEQDFSPEYRDLVDDVVLTDYTDWPTLRPLVEKAYEKWGFTAAVSLTEPGLDPVARVNDLLGLGGTPYEVSHRFTDKWLMRRRLAETPSSGLRPVAAELVDGQDSLVRFGETHGYPFVVKPTGGTASFGVTVVQDRAGTEPAWHHVQHLRDGSGHPLIGAYEIDRFVMEEYVEGPLYSAEAFSFGGRHVVLAVTEAITEKRNHVHVGHAIPARLATDVEEAVADTAVRFLDAMGFRDGSTHTEIILGPDGPVICESQNRVGGALLTDMIQDVYGHDPMSMAIGWPMGLVEPLPDRPERRGAAASWLLLADEGRVERIEGLDEIRAAPDTVAVDLWVGPGDQVRPFAGQWDGLGHIAVRGPDTDTAVARARAAAGRLRIHTRPA